MRRLLLALCGACAALGCAHSETALSPRDQAMVDLQQGRPEKAVSALESLHAGAPEDLDVARALVEAYVKLGRGAELVGRLEREKASHPTAVTYYMLGLAHFAQTADAEPATSDFQQAIGLAPKQAELHYRLGVALLEAERYEAALPPLQRAAELAPGRGGIALPLAKALYRTGHRKEAVDALRKFVAQDPTPAEVATARALMDSIADPFAGVPQAARGRIDEGLVWLEQKEVPENAIVTFEDVLHDYPDLAGVHALLALAYQRIDDAGQAAEELQHAIQLAPDDGKNQLFLGILYASHQRPTQARDCFEKAVALNPMLDDAYARLGDMALERRDLPQARDYFRALASLEPDQAPPRGKLALALQLDGDYAGAQRELERVLDKDPENVEFMLRLGILNAEKAAHSTRPEERRRALEDGAKWLHKVLEKQPENAVASKTLEALKPR